MKGELLSFVKLHCISTFTDGFGCKITRLAVCTGPLSLKQGPERRLQAEWIEGGVFLVLDSLLATPTNPGALGAPRESLLKGLTDNPGNYTPLGAPSSAFHSRTTNPTAFQEACGNHIEEKSLQNYPHN